MDSAHIFVLQSWAVFLSFFQGGAYQLALKFAPFVVFLEMPLYLITWAGVAHYVWRRRHEIPTRIPYYPKVSCISNSYAEGRDVQYSINSLLEQNYPGHLQIIVVLDGAAKNQHTYRAIKELVPRFKNYPNRSVRFVPKAQRGGRVSATNTGLHYATGEIVMALDADTSFDNDMVTEAVQPFFDPNVVGATGPLRVRNVKKSLATRLQAVEYMMAIYLGKIGLAEWNVINNLPGAYMIYRKWIIDRLGGWDTGTAEDLDLTLRIKQYLKRHPELKLVFATGAIAHTDVPDTFLAFYKQRLRWDGDLSYVYFEKHWHSFSGMIGWRNFASIVWYGLLFQIFLPLMLLIYTCYLAFTQPATFAVGVFILVYAFYFLVTFIQYALFLVLLSERPREDIELLWVMPIMPLFMMTARLWSVVATLHEWFNRAHLDSNMGPYWVIRQGGPR